MSPELLFYINWALVFCNVLVAVHVIRSERRAKRVTLALLWIINKRLKMGLLFSPHELTIIETAADWVEDS